MPDVLKFYVHMKDSLYEMTRAQRAIQEKNILGSVPFRGAGKRLLDVGAGGGIMVEVASQEGYEATGVEPSLSLQKKANELGLNVISGTISNLERHHRYDVITSIDVLEHVTDPISFLQEINHFMSDDGVAVIVTPNRKSFFAKLLGWR
jgi:2-polyprenyl-3-methyl-5-hydroxy-6-metoxy-1,4-benzoquinol methylase